MLNYPLYSFARSCCTVLSAVLSLTLMVTSGIVSAEPNGQADVEFSLIRSFSLPEFSENLQSELFRKTQGDVAIADIVALNREFSAEHGKPMTLPPQFAPKTHTIILKFPDGWWTTNIVSADGKGALICRVKMRFFEPKPTSEDIGKYVDWCHGILKVGVLDPSLFENPRSP